MNEATEAAHHWDATTTIELRNRENALRAAPARRLQAALRLHRLGYQTERRSGQSCGAARWPHADCQSRHRCPIHRANLLPALFDRAPGVGRKLDRRRAFW